MISMCSMFVRTCTLVCVWSWILNYYSVSSRSWAFLTNQKFNCNAMCAIIITLWTGQWILDTCKWLAFRLSILVWGIPCGWAESRRNSGPTQSVGRPAPSTRMRIHPSIRCTVLWVTIHFPCGQRAWRNYRCWNQYAIHCIPTRSRFSICLDFKIVISAPLHRPFRIRIYCILMSNAAKSEFCI